MYDPVDQQRIVLSEIRIIRLLVLKLCIYLMNRTLIAYIGMAITCLYLKDIELLYIVLAWQVAALSIILYTTMRPCSFRRTIPWFWNYLRRG